jgi:flagellar biosynthesis protein
VAVALRYERDDLRAPRVTARGAGELAQRILALAQQHDVPVREDPDLLELLAACDLGAEIPPELYHAVAELLAFFQRLNGARAPS